MMSEMESWNLEQAANYLKLHPEELRRRAKAGTVPAAVDEAFRRLAEYMAAAKRGSPGTTRERVTAGSVTVDKSRSASWAAAAMANSGAGDLLRNFRRV